MLSIAVDTLSRSTVEVTLSRLVEVVESLSTPVEVVEGRFRADAGSGPRRVLSSVVECCRAVEWLSRAVESVELSRFLDGFKMLSSCCRAVEQQVIQCRSCRAGCRAVSELY